jgi:hypothetical protein
MRLLRWEVNELSSNVVGPADWEEFENNLCWRVIKGEIKARDAYITQCLRLGDDVWSDGEMRARLNELEFIITIPQAIMLDLKLSKKSNNDEGE